MAGTASPAQPRRCYVRLQMSTPTAPSASRFDLVSTALVLALSAVSGFALIDGVEHVILSGPKVIYVELFAAAIAVTALIDLVRRHPRAGTVYRAVLGAVGLLLLAWYHNVVVSSWRLVLAVVLYAIVVCLAAADQVRSRRHG